MKKRFSFLFFIASKKYKQLIKWATQTFIEYKTKWKTTAWFIEMGNSIGRRQHQSPLDSTIRCSFSNFVRSISTVLTHFGNCLFSMKIQFLFNSSTVCATMSHSPVRQWNCREVKSEWTKSLSSDDAMPYLISNFNPAKIYDRKCKWYW